MNHTGIKKQATRLLSLLVMVGLLAPLAAPAPALAAAREWTWMSGTSMANQLGTYGTKGTPAAANVPGGRDSSISWIDGGGNLWLFGERGYDSTGTLGFLNDLWRYSPTTGEWTWMSGADTVGQAGTYGSRGTPDPANVPGARWGSISWIDGYGALWLFGGWGYTGSGSGYLNDLWRYNPATGEWTWMSGAKTIGQWGIYGSQGTPDPANVPGARHFSISWIDRAGALWLFGGYGCASPGSTGFLNDLWRYDPASGEWTWMSGANTAGQLGTYGTQGTSDVLNVPGAREFSISWIDGDGALWLFGGFGYDSAGPLDRLNDLWRYEPATGQWAWMSGASTRNQAGTYGTQGTPDPANVPGARDGSISWIDSAGSLWLLGGYGYASTGEGYLNDLWRYDPASGEWTWMSGASAVDQAGAYGAQGTPDPANVPGGRSSSISWIDGDGALWLFGGYGRASADAQGYMNDLWRYETQYRVYLPLVRR
jgi:N-acetylneuraminic acid mutarotase